MPHVCARSDRMAFVRNCYRWMLGTSDEETAALVVVARTKRMNPSPFCEIKTLMMQRKMLSIFLCVHSLVLFFLGRSNHYTLADQNCYLWYEIFIGFSTACVRLTKLIIYNAQFSLAFRQLVSDRNQVREWNKFETYTTQWDTWRWHHSLSVPVATHCICSNHMPSLENRSWP